MEFAMYWKQWNLWDGSHSNSISLVTGMEKLFPKASAFLLFILSETESHLIQNVHSTEKVNLINHDVVMSTENTQNSKRESTKPNFMTPEGG